MNCATPNCARAVPWSSHRFCSDCIGVVLRTGRPPLLPVPPAWLKRLIAKDLTRAAA